VRLVNVVKYNALPLAGRQAELFNSNLAASQLLTATTAQEGGSND
jgi:hypothetical protein